MRLSQAQEAPAARALPGLVINFVLQAHPVQIAPQCALHVIENACGGDGDVLESDGPTGVVRRPWLAHLQARAHRLKEGEGHRRGENGRSLGTTPTP